MVWIQAGLVNILCYFEEILGVFFVINMATWANILALSLQSAENVRWNLPCHLWIYIKQRMGASEPHLVVTAAKGTVLICRQIRANKLSLSQPPWVLRACSLYVTVLGEKFW
jgi:hypothetical protein